MVTKEGYVPTQGDIVWVHIEEALGHEQKGRRPAVIVSGNAYNMRTGLCLVCLITSKQKDYPFEINFESGSMKGSVLTDQIRLFDYVTRKFKKVGQVDKETILKVKKKIITLIS
jgi:mRNA interferase MazF